MSRQEFTEKTKAQAFLNCKGLCQGCGVKLTSATGIQYDHSTACGIGGDNSLSNCSVLCRNCHGAKTCRDDVPRIAKAKRNHRKAIGIRKQTTSFRGWKSMAGEPRWADANKR